MDDKRFNRFLLDGGFSFGDEYVPPVWSIQDNLNPKSPFTYLEWEDEHKQLCDETVDELNKLQDEVDNIKHTIKEAYLSERTMLGKSVLRQLMENIGEE